MLREEAAEKYFLNNRKALRTLGNIMAWDETKTLEELTESLKFTKQNLYVIAKKYKLSFVKIKAGRKQKEKTEQVEQKEVSTVI